MLRMTTAGCGLMVEVFKLLYLVSGSSDNFSKNLIIHVVLFITIT